MEGITIRVEVDPLELKEALLRLDYDELLSFIKEIDEIVGEWDFTKDLHEHFAKEMKECPEGE